MKRIEESIHIEAPPDRVWALMADPSSWHEWSRAVVPGRGAACSIFEGCTIEFSVDIYGFHLIVSPRVEVVEDSSCIVWSGDKLGVSSQHEFRFSPAYGGTQVVSTEDLSGLPITLMGPLFPLERIRQLTRTMLMDLKVAAEGVNGNGVS